MDKDIERIRKLAGINEDELAARRRAKERAANLQRQSEMMNTADELNRLIDQIADLILKEIEATEFSGWQSEGRPGNFQEYFRGSLGELGEHLIANQAEAFKENLEDIILRKVQERLS